MITTLRQHLADTESGSIPLCRHQRLQKCLWQLIYDFVAKITSIGPGAPDGDPEETA